MPEKAMPAIDLKRINKEGLKREVQLGMRVEEKAEDGLTFSFSS